MKKKGFTLIELLAVIVILAIIAVIATPIIVGIIEDSRKAAFERSVEGILHATDIDFGTQEALTDDSYEIENGQIKDKTLKTPIKNIDGFNGTIKYDEKGNSEYAIYNDKWCMKKIDGVITTEEYDSETCKVPNPYANGTPIYFDVVNGTGCSTDDYHEDNSKTGYNGIDGTGNQTSCLKFYAFNYKDGDAKVNLLLDHNTTADIYWTDSSLTTWTDSSFSLIKKGPVDVIKQLYEDTILWNGTVIPVDYILEQTVGGNYIIPYETNSYKARLITAQEIAKITGNTAYNETNSGWQGGYYFDTNTTEENEKCSYEDTSGCRYEWLYDRTSIECTNRGCLNNSDVHTFGYWTATSTFKSNSSAWGVDYTGKLISQSFISSDMDENDNEYYFVDDFFDYGVRPVIEVLVSNL